MKISDILKESTLTSDEPSQQLKSYIERKTDPNVVEINLNVLEPRLAEVFAIWSHKERGAGHASKALKILVSAADHYGVTLTLTPHWLAYDTQWDDEDDPLTDTLDALNDQKLDNEALVRWYTSVGFERTGEFSGDDPIMIRHPKRINI